MSDSDAETTAAVTETDDLTSILNRLENNYYSVDRPDFDEIQRRTREFIQFLNSTILGVVVSGRSAHRKRCNHEVSKVQRTILMIHKQARVRNNTSDSNRYSFQCRVCEITVVVRDKRDFWGQLQQHEHLEQLWAEYLVGGCEAVQREVERGAVAMQRAAGAVPWRDDTVLRYDGAVREVCYPMEFMRQVFFVDRVPEFTMQFRGVGVSCLLCNIPAVLIGSSLMDHMQGSKHRNNAKDALARASLSTYHTNFSRLPPNQQAHSIYFSTKKLDRVRCRICKESVSYFDLQEHILGSDHKTAIMARLQNERILRQEALLSLASTVYPDDDDNVEEEGLNGEVEASVASTSNSSTVNSSYAATNGGDDENEDKPAEFKFNFAISQEEESAVDEVENAPTPANVPQPDTPLQADLSYDPSIMEVTYPERIRTLSHQMDSVPHPYYTVQILSETDCHCLLCHCSMEGRATSIKIHLRGAKHQRNASSEDLLLALKEYHVGCMRLPAQLQPHVVYLAPGSQKRARCRLCGEHVMYGGALEAHILGNGHRVGVLKRLQCGLYQVRETLLRRALLVYPGVVVGEEVGENGRVGNGSVAVNGVVEVTKSAAPNSKKPIHDIVTSITNRESQSFFDQLENRFRSHLNLLEERPIDIHCKCCNTTILKTRYEVKKHIISDEHKKKAGVQNKRYKFVCDVCRLTQKKEAAWQEHFQMEPHRRRMEEIPALKREYLMEYECRTCNTIIFGDTVALRKHKSFLRNKQNKRYRKEITLSESVKLLFQSESHINTESNQSVFAANSVIENQENVWTCCRALETVLSKVFENCRAYPFGSRVSGLGNQNSDLDVFVDVGDMYFGQNRQDAKSQEFIVKEAAKVFRKFPGRVFTHINPVPTARTPIVQIFHTVTQLDCDLSFRHGLSVENTKFLRVCIGIQPITQHLILMLKQWSQFSKLDENITTYALSMMSIFYLQTRDLLLPVKKLRTLNPEPAHVIDGWDTINYTLSFDAMRTHVQPFTGTLKELLSDFFKYYSEFKFETDVVCPLLGHTIKKSDFNGPTGDLLPPEMQSYVVKLRTEEEPELFRALSPFCVQDPFDLSHNLTKACSDFVVEKLQILCDLSANYVASVK